MSGTVAAASEYAMKQKNQLMMRLATVMILLAVLGFIGFMILLILA